MSFEETQVPPRLWTLASVVPGVIVVIAALVTSTAGQPVPLAPVVAAAAVTLGIGIWVRRIALVTEVSDDTITLRYRGLLKTRTVPISSIRRMEERTYHPLREYGGWGIKRGASGWVYNISGNRGVQLHLADHKPLLIGSGRPQQLAEAIASSPAYDPTSQT